MYTHHEPDTHCVYMSICFGPQGKKVETLFPLCAVDLHKAGKCVCVHGRAYVRSNPPTPCTSDALFVWSQEKG